jgi:saccharopine dehydrogenase-like NADP-dependent oxidoreductase
MFEAAARGQHIGKWLAIDRAWRPERRERIERLGVQTADLDVLDDRQSLDQLTGSAAIVANFAGPYYRTGSAVLDSCIATGTDYLDICDDADATLTLLERDDAAREAGVRALIGMGSSPGVVNVFVRLAVDAMGSADIVEISWTSDVSEVGSAVAQHVWHIFSLVDEHGVRRPVPSWEELSSRTVEFPEPVGTRLVVEFSHPEPITIPRFLPVGSVTNFGGIWPEDTLIVSWALARLGASEEATIEIDGNPVRIPDLAVQLYERYRAGLGARESGWGGLHVDVHTDGDGYRFAAADGTSMEESTGTPAAAGIGLMLAGDVPGPGVFAPECLDPARVLPALGRVSQGKGSFALHRLENGNPTERLRIRDLLSLAPESKRS